MGTEQYPPPAYVAPAPSQPGKGFATASLVCSLVGLLFSPCIILGIIFGFVAINQMKGTAGEGKGMAKAGIIIGFCGIGLYLICCVLYIVLWGGIALLGGLAGSSS